MGISCSSVVPGEGVFDRELIYPRQGSNLRPFAPEANALIH